MFPSVLTTFSYPTASNRLNSPSHSAQHDNINSVMGQVQAVIGLADSASTLGTIIGDLRSPGSNGGGHVQTANKGGTGQTVYAKGDILAAASSSVLSKLAIGTDGQALVADSSQSSGVKWGNVVSNKIAINPASVAFLTSSPSIVILYTASILANSLGSGNAIKFSGAIQNMALTAENMKFTVNYGNNVIASVTALNNSGSIMTGTVEGTIVANGSASSQVGWIKMNIGNTGANTGGATFPFATGTGYGSSSIASTSDQNLIITGQVALNGHASITTGAFIVEKIA